MEHDQYVLVDGSSHLGDIIFNYGLKKVKDARVRNHQRKVNETYSFIDMARGYHRFAGAWRYYLFGYKSNIYIECKNLKGIFRNLDLSWSHHRCNLLSDWSKVTSTAKLEINRAHLGTRGTARLIKSYVRRLKSYV